MTTLTRRAPSTAGTLVGYQHRHTHEVVCVNCGPCDIVSPRSPWTAVRTMTRRVGIQLATGSTAPVLCSRCDRWLNDEDTNYAVVIPHEGYLTRLLRRRRGRESAGCA
jgi:hypothetical protein